MKNSMLLKVIGEVEITKDLILLLLIGGLYSLAIALSNTFVNIYLWKQSGKFFDIALYNLAAVILQPITFIVAGKWAKMMDRVIVLRIGVITLTCFYSTVLLLSEQAHAYLTLLGALLGIGFGFYWLAFNILTFEITEPHTRDFFNGFLGLLTSFAGMVGPIVSGTIIMNMSKFTGYTVIFTISFILFFIAMFISFLLKRRAASGKFHVREVIKERKKNANWHYVLYAHFFQGLREGIFVFVIVIWVYVATNSEFALGLYGLVTSTVQFISYYVVTRLVKNKFRKMSILFGGLILFFAVFIILFDATFTMFMTYGVIISLAYPLLLVPYISLTYDVIGTSRDAGRLRVEYIVVRELFLNGGRAVSIIVFLLAITIWKEQVAIPLLLALFGAGHAIIYLFIRRIHVPKQVPLSQSD